MEGNDTLWLHFFSVSVSVYYILLTPKLRHTGHKKMRSERRGNEVTKICRRQPKKKESRRTFVAFWQAFKKRGIFDIFLDILDVFPPLLDTILCVFSIVKSKNINFRHLFVFLLFHSTSFHSRAPFELKFEISSKESRSRDLLVSSFPQFTAR